MRAHYSFFRSVRAKASLVFFVVFLLIILPVLSVIYLRVTTILAEADTRELKAEAEKLLSQVRIDPPVIPLPPPGYALSVQRGQDFLFEDIFTSPGFPDIDKDVLLLDVYEYDTVKLVNLRRPNGLVLSLARSNVRLLGQVREVRLYLFLASAAAMLIAGALVFMAAGVMLRPLERIIQAAEKINASNSIERVPVPGTADESERLAETLNAMLSRIEGSIKNQINFFASATHELKTPLAVMQTELSVSLNAIIDPETKKILESQLVEVQRLDSIIHDFLLISQLKSESLTLRKGEESLQEVVYAAVRRMRYLSLDRQTLIQVTIEDQSDLMCSFDFDKMQTVLTNLIENALKYSPSHSVVRIKVKKYSVDVINPVVKPVEDIGSLVSEFKKSEELSAGLGMGLWLCDQIVRLHGGSLVLSQEGLQFTARFDVSPP